jgi:polysaccharide pyruvyl transferase WcaK-like protein
VRLEPVPIALHERSPDHEAIRLLLAGLDDASDGGRTLDTPEAATRAAGRCRVVVTGAYHSAVFALAQGVPVVAVVGSELYGDKFRGLEEQFGDAVRLVPVAEAAFGARLLDAVQATWHAADALHPRTIGAVRGIVELNRAAYAQAFDRVTAGVGVR